MERKRLVADRFRRVWRIIEDIANEPGRSRRELAQRFVLSERQVQADLNLIRNQMRLPLVRRRGYRFESAVDRNSISFTLHEAQLLLTLLRQAAGEQFASPEALASLATKLPSIFPPHLQPLVGKTLAAFPASSQHQGEVFAALAEALLSGSAVRLHYLPGDSPSSVREPVVNPELLMPFLESWYLLGRCQQRGRVMMFDLSSVSAISVQPPALSGSAKHTGDS